MAHISLRVSEQEKKWMESYAEAHGMNLSDAVKTAFFEKLEDEYDLKVIEEYENEKKSGNVKYHSLADVKKELGIDDEI
ncbi:type II toxin-antitoxin system RelB family antitoxin [Sedimentibacter sp.]|uniref:type II toxin-antitoxin system RelB family antitoxin n=1 Tax=Sedimentibacter sp. TaxID=1960295 RepID=UPI002896E048|nr:DUF6290 family protein [Sedimentibacter sp.]